MRPPILLLILLPFLSGCWSYTPAQPKPSVATVPIPADAWPTRNPDAVRPILEATPREVFGYRVIDGVDPSTLPEADRRLVEKPQYIVTYKGIQANALLRIYDQGLDDKVTIGTSREKVSFNDAVNKLVLGFTPNAHIMSSRTLDSVVRRASIQRLLTPVPDPKDELAAKPTQPNSLSIVRTNAPKIEALESTHLLRLEDGLPLRIPAAKPDAPKPKGLIIHLHAIAGNPYEPQVMQEFTRRGWAVIDVKTETSIECPIPEAWKPEITALSTEFNQLSKQIYVPSELSKATTVAAAKSRAESNPLYPRYQKVQARLSKLIAGGFQVCNDSDLPAVAEKIAHDIDNGLAGSAYATQAVLDYVAQERPDLQGIPVVLIGFSAGALATPTAAVRVHDRLSAVVMIGGGCDLFRISQTSSFTDGGLKVLCGEKKAPKSTIDKLDALYLKDTKLDPYRTAPLITDLPTLLVLASSDTWVPAQTGQLLYDQLNHPERLTMAADHDLLFYFLPNRKEWIADWVEKTVASHPQSK